MEYWLPINSLYSISTFGRVWSAKVGVMKTPPMNTGYPHVNIMINKVPKRKLVHRLLAEAFIPNPENKPFINHKNGIKSDNRIENLEWCTTAENNRHSAFVLGRKGAKNNHRRKKILATHNESGKTIEKLGIREMARALGIPYQGVQNGIKNNNLLYFGWSFKILDDPKWISSTGLRY